jgi:hypothetical protein
MSYEDDDDDAFDERGVLRDGHRFRVPLMMQDAMQRDIASHAARLHDGRGGPVGHRPGFIYSTDAATQDVAQAYAEYAQQARDAWKSPGHEVEIKPLVLTGDAREDVYRARDAADADAWRGPSNSGKWPIGGGR